MSRLLPRRLAALLLIAGLMAASAPPVASAAAMPDERCAQPQHSCEKAGPTLQCCCGHDLGGTETPAQTESRTQLTAPSFVPVPVGTPVTTIVPVLVRRGACAQPPRARSAPDRLALISTFLL